ncbi:MAG: hypothetical protein IJO60_00935 [Agathobacter sp.]|nr:hypothetical protein [Agathobacter sp.]
MQSMDEVYQKYAQMVYRYLLSLTHDSDLAEELTQETFYQAIKGIHKYDESCKKDCAGRAERNRFFENSKKETAKKIDWDNSGYGCNRYYSNYCKSLFWKSDFTFTCNSCSGKLYSRNV